MKIVLLEDGDIVVSRGSLSSRDPTPWVALVSFLLGAVLTKWYYASMVGF